MAMYLVHIIHLYPYKEIYNTYEIFMLIIELSKTKIITKIDDLNLILANKT